MKRIPLWHLAVVVVLCLLAYGNSLTGAFLWDDDLQIIRNPFIRDLANIPAAFTQSVWAFLHPGHPNTTNFYRPLQTVAYILSYAMGGLSPVPYHITNLLLHVLASITVYAICVELGFAGMLALLGSALFATHPIHTEAVSWIAATPEVFCGFLYLLAMWSFLKSDGGARRAWWLFSALVFFAALLAKEMAITLPAILFLLTFRPVTPRLSMARRVTLLVPYGVSAAVYLATRIHALGFLGVLSTNTSQAVASTFDWITLGVQAFGQYLWLSLVPYPLIAYHMLPLRLEDRAGTTLLAVAAIVALAFVAWKFRQRLPEGLLWYGIFFVALIPVFNLRGISSALMSERYLYIPSLAPIVLALTLIQHSKSKQRWIWAAWALVGVFTVTTILRNQDWSSPQRLYSTTLDQDPNVTDFRLSLAEVLIDHNDDRNAVFQLTRALESGRDGRYNQAPFDDYLIHINLAFVLLRAGDFDQASSHLALAARSNPEGEWPVVYSGAILMARDADDAGAINLLQAGLKINPNNDFAHDYLGTAYFNLGRIPEALAEFQTALRINPNLETARQHLALAQQRISRPN